VHERVRRFLTLTATLAMAAHSGCVFGGGSRGTDQVRDLAVRVEAVQEQAQLAQETSAAALRTLQQFATGDFGGNPLAAYSVLQRAVTAAAQQEETLRLSLEPMQKAAEQLFAGWGSDLETYASPEMQQRSQERLRTNRERVQAVVQTTAATLTLFTEVNRNLRDHVLDLNQESLLAVQSEVQALVQRASGLDRKLGECRAAARAYADSIALPTVPIGTPAAPAPDRGW
jgi:hypothetical protein